MLDIPEITKLRFPAADNANSDLIRVDLQRRVNGTPVTADGVSQVDVRVNGADDPRDTLTTSDGVEHTATDGLSLNLEGSFEDLEIEDAALRVRGLRGFRYRTKPFTTIGLDTAAGQAQPLAIDVNLDPTRRDAMFLRGHLDRLPEDLLLKIGKQKDSLIDYSAAQRISELHLETSFLRDGDLLPVDEDAPPDEEPFTIPGAQATVTHVPTQFEVCMNGRPKKSDDVPHPELLDVEQASCMIDNRFTGEQLRERQFSLAYQSDVTSSGPRPHVLIRGCFDSETCTSGTIADINVDVPKRIEIDLGAGATGPTVSRFDCWDEVDSLEDTFAVPGGLACTAAYPFKAAGEALGSAKASAYLWTSTGNTSLDGSVTVTLPSPVGFLAPIVFVLNVPTIKANNAFVEAEASLQAFLDGTAAQSGGSLTCSGGNLGVSTRFRVVIPDIDTSDFFGETLLGLINGVIDIVNLDNPFADDHSGHSHLADKVVIPDINQPLGLSLIDELC